MDKKLYKNKEWLETQIKEIGYKEIIGRSIGVSGDTIHRWCKKYGIETPKMPSIRRKATFNLHFFETIDTEEKAYWLGFLMADGCVSKSGRLSIILKNDDIEHLRKFSKSLELQNTDIIEKNITDKRGFVTTRAEVRINSVELCQSLEKYGIVCNKTGKEIMSSNIPKELKRHFIRGFFDGDGSICKVYKRQYNRIHLGSCSLSIIQDIIENVFQETQIELKYYISNSYSRPFYYIDCTHKQHCKDFIKYLYNDCNIYLDRKYKLAQETIGAQ